jgi:histone deacetylase complex regulatory component SIN3
MANNPDPAAEFTDFLARAQSRQGDAEPTAEPKPPLGNYVPREGTVISQPPPNAVQQFAGWLQSAIDSVPDPR